MIEFFQEKYDFGCEQIKAEVLRLVEDCGYGSIAMAIAMGAPNILPYLFELQEEINPAAEELGINTKTLSELFGVDIKFSVKED